MFLTTRHLLLVCRKHALRTVSNALFNSSFPAVKNFQCLWYDLINDYIVSHSAARKCGHLCDGWDWFTASVVKYAHILNGCEWKGNKVEAQPKMVTYRVFFVCLFLFVFVCWCGCLIFLPELVYMHHNVLCYMLHFSHYRIQKSFFKASFCH